MVQALMERNSELQALRQHLGGKDFVVSHALISNQPAEITSVGSHLGEQTDQVRAIDLCRYSCQLHFLFLFKHKPGHFNTEMCENIPSPCHCDHGSCIFLNPPSLPFLRVPCIYPLEMRAPHWLPKWVPAYPGPRLVRITFRFIKEPLSFLPVILH